MSTFLMFAGQVALPIGDEPFILEICHGFEVESVDNGYFVQPTETDKEAWYNETVFGPVLRKTEAKEVREEEYSLDPGMSMTLDGPLLSGSRIQVWGRDAEAVERRMIRIRLCVADDTEVDYGLR